MVYRVITVVQLIIVLVHSRSRWRRQRRRRQGDFWKSLGDHFGAGVGLALLAFTDRLVECWQVVSVQLVLVGLLALLLVFLLFFRLNIAAWAAADAHVHGVSAHLDRVLPFYCNFSAQSTCESQKYHLSGLEAGLEHIVTRVFQV